MRRESETETTFSCSCVYVCGEKYFCGWTKWTRENGKEEQGIKSPIAHSLKKWERWNFSYINLL